jgi:hypothetical protein
MNYESPEITQNREARRAGLSVRTAELLNSLGNMPADKRLAWYRAHRGCFFFDPADLPGRIALIHRLDPARRAAVLDAAGRLLRHEFDILGSGVTPLGDTIDWQLDFKSGIRWRGDVIYPAWNWRQVEDLAGAEIYRGHFYSVDDASDLKVPWDLSSFLHLPTLVEAFLLTGDVRYAKEIEDQLRQWHEKNTYPRGVNWTCAMVAGIRIANLAFALRALEPPAFLGETGVLSVLRHIKFILDFLEVDNDGRRNNHYINNVAGLGFGAAEIARSALGRDLLRFTFDELVRELATEFSDDGTNYEGSIPYHCFATESAMLTAILLERNGAAIPSASRSQLVRMLRFIDVYTKPNRLAPQFGDNDNGRVLVLHDYAAPEFRDHRHVLALGAAWLGVTGLITDVLDRSCVPVWLLGCQVPPRANGPGIVAGLYASSGYAGAKTASSSLIVRCGRINPMSGGGHNHCDQLSFEFHDRGADLIVDPGAMVYSADAPLHNYARSTSAHNVLQLDDAEQQAYEAHDLFAMQDRAEATLDIWEMEAASLCFRGHHRGYIGWMVVREIRCDLDRGTLEVIDEVERLEEAAQGDEFCGRLHLAEGILVEQFGPTEFVLRSAGLGWTVRFSEGLCTAACGGRVSPSYGVVRPAVTLEYRFPAADTRRAGFTVERSVS